MVPLESLGVVSYSCSIATTAVSPFMKYSASNNGVTLKSGFGVHRSHWKRRRSIDHIRLSIGPPL